MVKKTLNNVAFGTGILFVCCVTFASSTIENANLAGPSTKVSSNESPAPNQELATRSEAASTWTALYHNIFASRTSAIPAPPEQVRSNLMEMYKLEKLYPSLQNADMITKLLGDSFGSKFITLANFSKQSKFASDLNSSLIETLLDTFNTDSNNCSDNNLKKFHDLVNKSRTLAELIYPTLKLNFELQFRECLERYMEIIQKSAGVLGITNLLNLNQVLDRSIDQTTGWTPFSIRTAEQHKEQILRLAQVLNEHLRARLSERAKASSSIPEKNVAKMEPEYLRFYREPCALFVSLAKPTIARIDKILSLVNGEHTNMKFKHTRFLNLYRLCARMGTDKRFFQFRSVNEMILNIPIRIEEQSAEIEPNLARQSEIAQREARDQLAEIMKSSPLFKPTFDSKDSPPDKKIKFPFLLDATEQMDTHFRDPIGQRASKLLKLQPTRNKLSDLAKIGQMYPMKRRTQRKTIPQQRADSPAKSEESVSNVPAKRASPDPRQLSQFNQLIFSSLPAAFGHNQQQEPETRRDQLAAEQSQQSAQGSSLAAKESNKRKWDKLLDEEDDDGGL